jgi:glycerophosphoryl diester phosphodiesterase
VTTRNRPHAVLESQKERAGIGFLVPVTSRQPADRSLDTTAGAIGARVIEADLFFFGGLGADAPLVVGQFHGFGLKVFGFTTNNAPEFFLQSRGLDGIYTNDVPLGVELEE